MRPHALAAGKAEEGGVSHMTGLTRQPEDRDTEELFYQHPVRAVPLGPPSEMQLELIRAHVVDPAILDEREPFVWLRDMRPASPMDDGPDGRSVEAVDQSQRPHGDAANSIPSTDGADIVVRQIGVRAFHSALEALRMHMRRMSFSRSCPSLRDGVMDIRAIITSPQMTASFIHNTIELIGTDTVVSDAGWTITDVEYIRPLCNRWSGQTPRYNVRAAGAISFTPEADFPVPERVDRRRPNPARPELRVVLRERTTTVDLLPEAISQRTDGATLTFPVAVSPAEPTLPSADAVRRRPEQHATQSAGRCDSTGGSRILIGHRRGTSGGVTPPAVDAARGHSCASIIPDVAGMEAA